MSAPSALAWLRARPHWSYSQINGLVEFCSLAWAFRYAYRLEPEFTPGSLVFGTAFHSALSYHAVRRMQGTGCTAAECGDLFAELQITVPKKLSQEQQELFTRLRALEQ